MVALWDGEGSGDRFSVDFYQGHRLKSNTSHVSVTSAVLDLLAGKSKHQGRLQHFTVQWTNILVPYQAGYFWET